MRLVKRNIFAIFYLIALATWAIATEIDILLEGVLGAPCPTNGIVLLGKEGDLSEWRMEKNGAKEIAWHSQDGVITIAPNSGSIITKRKFGDFSLHLEFNINPSEAGVQKEGNSGVCIQQRYEVLILNSCGKDKLGNTDCGAINKMRAPSCNVSMPPGSWQAYDISFRAARWDNSGNKLENARISVIHNGQAVHYNVELPDKTSGGEPEGPTDGPIKLADGGGTVKFRNIWIVPMKISK